MINSADSDAPPGSSDELVILIHGTFSGDRSGSDEGERWWQRGSETWSWLQERLPEGVTLADDDMRLFHWSGNNNQTDRFAASTKLLAQLVQLEKEGRRYHLVGHSHGGSIIWEALVSSVEIRSKPRVPLPKELRDELGIKAVKSRFRYPVPRRRFTRHEVYEWLELPGLRTWTTVGTPFLHYLPRKRWLIRGWPDSKFSIFGGGAEVFGRMALALIVSVMGFLLAVNGIKLVGTLIANTARPLYILGFLFFLLVALTYRRRIILRNLAEALIRREQTSCYTFLHFSGRWLGIWSPLDEAIAALKTSAPRMSSDYTWLCCSPRTRPPQSVPKDLPDILSGRRLPLQLTQPAGSISIIPEHQISSIRRFLSPLYYSYNRWLAPRVGLIISRVLLRSAQGSDIPGAFLAYVAPWPVPIRKPMGGLPKEISQSLEAAANIEAEKAVPALRQLLADASIEGPVALSSSVPMKVLLHTAYMGHPDVLNLIVLNVSHSLHTGQRSRCKHGTPRLCSWLRGTKAEVTISYQEFVSKVDQSWAGQRVLGIRDREKVLQYLASPSPTTNSAIDVSVDGRVADGRTAGPRVGGSSGLFGKVPRNTPCPCGSGRKYKLCHGDPRNR